MPSYPPNSPLQSGIDAQANFMTELTRRSYDSMRKLSELNLHFGQQLTQDCVAATRQILSCSDPFHMAATFAKAVQPAAQHLRSYQQQLIRMLTGSQLELVRDAESMLPAGGRYAAALAQAMADEALAEAGVTPDPLAAASRANGTASDSTGVHQAH